MTTQTPIEVRDMGIVHRTLRTTFDESARLVRAASDPTPERVAFLASHIALTLDLLHVHHSGEDECLWPVLVERAPAEAEMVRGVADQHSQVTPRSRTCVNCSTPGSRVRTPLRRALSPTRSRVSPPP